MGCSPTRKILHIRMPIIDCVDSPIIKARKKRNKKIVDELRVIEGYNDPFENYTNQVFFKETKYGSNYIVDHIITGKKRFMKVIKRAKATKISFTHDDLINQIDLLKHLVHPNIIQLYEVFESESKIYMIYEYCEGGDLLDALTSDSVFNESKCKFVMKQLFSALSYCHMKGIVHTSLCPEHIVIETKQKTHKNNNEPSSSSSDNNNPIVKLIDFGAFNLFSCRKELLTLGFKSISNPYFSSPELKEGISSDKCDIWSCGVIMYLLLSGELPFSQNKETKVRNKDKDKEKDKDIKKTTDIVDDNTEKNTSKTLKSTILKFEGEIWDTVSSDAKDLIAKCLTYNPKMRIDANKALKHDFFVYDTNKQKINDKAFNEVLTNIRTFTLRYKLQEAVLGYIVHHLLRKEDIDTIRKTFVLFDKNSDGKISKEELKEGLQRIMTPLQAELECEKILRNLKVNKNDAIEYEDFLAIALAKDKIVNERNLKLIFDMMDTNKNGKVTKFELKNFFLGNLTTESLMADTNFFAQIINEIDANGDGEINYQEFRKMMMVKSK